MASKSPDKIEIYFWNGSNPSPEHLDYTHGQIFKYETNKKYKRGLSKIISRVKYSGCNVLLAFNRQIFTTIVFIDDGRFRQS